eukprot:TRINITY_DN1779_c0_g1_i1.p1 TRINITY_DN1779_c0_g1~~TRINITY_DN1779_c0_g1_i1.p1  ORF type:complete len:123 (+),score=31.68 TRINITY_DN1779_c0_g1_i1:164-532(+)
MAACAQGSGLRMVLAGSFFTAGIIYGNRRNKYLHEMKQAERDEKNKKDQAARDEVERKRRDNEQRLQEQVENLEKALAIAQGKPVPEKPKVAVAAAPVKKPAEDFIDAFMNMSFDDEQDKKK